MKYNCLCLDQDQIDWVYEMWCIGATRLQIAEALNVCEQTIRRVTEHKPRVRPVLSYNPNWKKEGIRF